MWERGFPLVHYDYNPNLPPILGRFEKNFLMYYLAYRKINLNSSFGYCRNKKWFTNRMSSAGRKRHVRSITGFINILNVIGPPIAIIFGRFALYKPNKKHLLLQFLWKVKFFSLKKCTKQQISYQFSVHTTWRTP